MESFGLLDKFEEVKEMYRSVNIMLGDIVESDSIIKDGRRYGNIYGANSLTGKHQAKIFLIPILVSMYFKGMMGQPERGFQKICKDLSLRGRADYS